jgi:hypothetical protein
LLSMWTTLKAVEGHVGLTIYLFLLFRSTPQS